MPETEREKRAAVDRLAERMRQSAREQGHNISHEETRRKAVEVAKRHDRKQR
tara:strand:+ start:135 stop:290 length:156 start_codon:yes stop_codon:yes gene_type:complete